MHIISRRIHGILDYLVGLLLIVSPGLFGFADVGGPAATLPVVLGVAALIYSLITNYQLGLLKLLPFKTHLAPDAGSGLLLAVSPWLFQFADRVWVPHLAFGLFEIGAVFMTRTSASVTSHPV